MLQRFVSCLLLIGGFAFFLVRPASLLNPRIVGGNVTDIRQHPHQVSLQIGLWHFCGAVIISNKWILTAAHCVRWNRSSIYKINAGSNTTYEGVRYQVKKIIPHPNFVSLKNDYDIALLELDGEIRFNDRVQPVKLAEKELASGVMVNITGWGSLKEDGDESSMLMGTSVPIVDRKTCQKRYGKNVIITDRMICAGYTEGGKDSCQGDSGGPLVANDILIGLVSWGYGCAKPHYPGVYTNVANLRWWIWKTMALNN